MHIIHIHNITEILALFHLTMKIIITFNSFNLLLCIDKYFQEQLNNTVVIIISVP